MARIKQRLEALTTITSTDRSPTDLEKLTSQGREFSRTGKAGEPEWRVWHNNATGMPTDDRHGAKITYTYYTNKTTGSSGEELNATGGGNNKPIGDRSRPDFGLYILKQLGVTEDRDLANELDDWLDTYGLYGEVSEDLVVAFYNKKVLGEEVDPSLLKDAKILDLTDANASLEAELGKADTAAESSRLWSLQNREKLTETQTQLWAATTENGELSRKLNGLYNDPRIANTLTVKPYFSEINESIDTILADGSLSEKLQASLVKEKALSTIETAINAANRAGEDVSKQLLESPDEYLQIKTSLLEKIKFTPEAFEIIKENFLASPTAENAKKAISETGNLLKKVVDASTLCFSNSDDAQKWRSETRKTIANECKEIGAEFKKETKEMWGDIATFGKKMHLPTPKNSDSGKKTEEKPKIKR